MLADSEIALKFIFIQTDPLPNQRILRTLTKSARAKINAASI
jgi:hypothetical protein